MTGCGAYAMSMKPSENKPRCTSNVSSLSPLNRLNPSGLKEAKISKLCFICLPRLSLASYKIEPVKTKLFMKLMMFYE